MEQVETAVIGAGQAGLVMSYHLRRLGREHIVLERARVAERWRTQRWDSLMFQFPNWTIALPGHSYAHDDPDGFSHKDLIVRYLEDYRVATQAPVRVGINVRSLTTASRKGWYKLETDHGDLNARNVVIATGPYQRSKVPVVASGVPPQVIQIHASEYRNPKALPEGAVIVVGTGASGCQIAEELLESGRSVYLSVGRHRRIPRRYRGKDVFWWRRELGELDRAADATPSAGRQHAPLVTGVGGGHDIDLHQYAAHGMVLLGHIRGIDGSRILFAPDLHQVLATGDRAYDEFTDAVDEYVTRTGIQAPPKPVKSPVSSPAPEILEEIDVKAARVGSVIWATGYLLDFRWVRLPIFDGAGDPVHRNGVTRVPGIYLLGLPWLRKHKSSFLFGVGEDAEYLAEEIARRSVGSHDA
jgi:putative flavoprotein involved in K+ transport